MIREKSAREQRRLQSASMTARLTRVKTLDGFDFSSRPWTAIASCRWPS